VAYVEFTDSEGVEWQAWDVTRESLTSAHSDENYLGELRDGWIVFQSGTLTRRLSPIPQGWASRSPAELEHMCRDAQLVVKRERFGTLPKDRPEREPPERSGPA
jgi:hypothetical protein